MSSEARQLCGAAAAAAVLIKLEIADATACKLCCAIQPLTRVEVDIGVQLPGHKVVIAAGDLFQFHRNVNEGIPPGNLEDILSNLLDDGGPGVIVLVHPTGHDYI